MFRTSRPHLFGLAPSLVALWVTIGCDLEPLPAVELSPGGEDPSAPPLGLTTIQKEAERVRTQRPAFAAKFDALIPRRTRHGRLRYSDPLMDDPDAGVLFAALVSRGKGNAARRLAMADAIARSGGASANLALPLLENEDDPRVRRTLVASLRRCQDPHVAARGLVRGLDDPKPLVREQAARLAASHPAAASQVIDRLLAGLDDPDHRVRIQTTRALGILGHGEAVSTLRSRLTAPVADERLETLRALRRLDPAMIGGANLVALANDPDPRVAAEANRILTGGQDFSHGDRDSP